MIRVLGIAASPRRGGNSETLLDEALRSAALAGAATSKIILNELKFRPCQACGGCDRTGHCVLRDDMDKVYAALREADGIVVASPLYFGGVSAQLKMMIDRFQCEWVRMNALGGTVDKPRQGAFVCAAGSATRELFDLARRGVRIFFNVMQISYTGDVFCGGVEEPGASSADSEAMAGAYRLGGILGKGA